MSSFNDYAGSATQARMLTKPAKILPSVAAHTCPPASSERIATISPTATSTVVTTTTHPSDTQLMLSSPRTYIMDSKEQSIDIESPQKLATLARTASDVPLPSSHTTLYAPRLSLPVGGPRAMLLPDGMRLSEVGDTFDSPVSASVAPSSHSKRTPHAEAVTTATTAAPADALVADHAVLTYVGDVATYPPAPWPGAWPAVPSPTLAAQPSQLALPSPHNMLQPQPWVISNAGARSPALPAVAPALAPPALPALPLPAPPSARTPLAPPMTHSGFTHAPPLYTNLPNSSSRRWGAELPPSSPSDGLYTPSPRVAHATHMPAAVLDSPHAQLIPAPGMRRGRSADVESEPPSTRAERLRSHAELTRRRRAGGSLLASGVSVSAQLASPRLLGLPNTSSPAHSAVSASGGCARKRALPGGGSSERARPREGPPCAPASASSGGGSDVALSVPVLGSMPRASGLAASAHSARSAARPAPASLSAHARSDASGPLSSGLSARLSTGTSTAASTPAPHVHGHAHALSLSSCGSSASGALELGQLSDEEDPPSLAPHPQAQVRLDAGLLASPPRRVADLHRLALDASGSLELGLPIAALSSSSATTHHSLAHTYAFDGNNLRLRGAGEELVIYREGGLHRQPLQPPAPPAPVLARSLRTFASSDADAHCYLSPGWRGSAGEHASLPARATDGSGEAPSRAETSLLAPVLEAEESGCLKLTRAGARARVDGITALTRAASPVDAAGSRYSHYSEVLTVAASPVLHLPTPHASPPETPTTPARRALAAAMAPPAAVTPVAVHTPALSSRHSHMHTPAHSGLHAHMRPAATPVATTATVVAPSSAPPSTLPDAPSLGDGHTRAALLPGDQAFTPQAVHEVCVLGRGATAAVRLAWASTAEEVVAVKEVKVMLKADRESLRSEFGVLLAIRSPALLALRGAFTREGAVALVVEYLAGGDLGALVAAQRRVRAHAMGLASPPRGGIDGNGNGDGTAVVWHEDVGADAQPVCLDCAEGEEEEESLALSPKQVEARLALRRLGWRAPEVCGGGVGGHVRVRVDWAAVKEAVAREQLRVGGKSSHKDDARGIEATPAMLAEALQELPGACLCEVGLRAVAAGLARALSDLHAANRAHHDVKPQNVLLGREGEVKLGDFGLARRVDASPTDARVADAVGTRAYLSPEQVLGLPGSGLAKDIWALGLTLFVAATGRQPVPVEYWAQQAYASQYRDGDIDPGPLFSAQARAFVQACLTKDPVARPSAAQLLTHPWLAGTAQTSAPSVGVREWLRQGQAEGWATEAPDGDGWVIVAPCPPPPGPERVPWQRTQPLLEDRARALAEAIVVHSVGSAAAQWGAREVEVLQRAARKMGWPCAAFQTLARVVAAEVAAREDRGV